MKSEVDLAPDYLHVVRRSMPWFIAALAFRYALGSGSPSLLREHWPGRSRFHAAMRLAYRGGVG